MLNTVEVTVLQQVAGTVKTLTPSVAAAATVTAAVVKTAVLAPSIGAAATVTAAVVKTAVLGPAVSAVSSVTAALSGAVGTLVFFRVDKPVPLIVHRR